jgi:hypothetical protein
MTPLEALEPLLNVLNKRWIRTLKFLEPCKGDGAIYNAIQPVFKEHAELSEGVNYLKTTFADIDLIITNPPFSQALPFLQKSLSEAETVIYLLRLNFLGSQARRSFWQENRPTHVLTLAKRPAFVKVCKGRPKIITLPKISGCGSSFPLSHAGNCTNCGHRVGAGTDSTEYAWFCWDRLGIVDLPTGVHVL